MGKKVEKTVAGGNAKTETTSNRIEHDDGTVEYVSRQSESEAVDKQSADSFPASDPPCATPHLHEEKPKHGTPNP